MMLRTGQIGRTLAMVGVVSGFFMSLAGPSSRARAEFTFEIVKSFQLPDRGPGALVLGSDGALYGSTVGGGPNNYGTIFRIDNDGGFTTLHTFNGTDGFDPGASLVLGSDGALYGTTTSGGSSNAGTIFRIDSAGTFTLLHSFDPALVHYHGGALVLGSDGGLYGTTPFGGSFDHGTVFKIDSAGNFRLLHSFSGARPSGALVVGRDGALYGTAPSIVEGFAGEIKYDGAVFRIDSDGNFTILHSFEGSDGFYLIPALALGSDGALYGTTYADFSGGFGKVFKVNAAGTYTVLHSFNYADGSRPVEALVLGSDGALYGCTEAGGSADVGTFFRIDSAGTFTSLYSFTDRANYPSRHLVLGPDGAFYGTSQTTAFKLDSDGNFTSLHSFPSGVNAILTVGSDGALYGTTDTVFRIDSSGAFTSLHTFNSADGLYPQTPLVQGSDGALYGTTPSVASAGTIFRIDGAGAFTSLHSFADGSSPSALVAGADGALYGTFISSWGNSTVFRIESDGTFTTPHALTGFTSPDALVRGEDGALYGTTSISPNSGNYMDYGTVFKIDMSGSFTLLLNSSDVGSCDAPYGRWSSSVGPIALGSDGAIYGLNTVLCFYGEGDYYLRRAILRIDTAGAITTLHVFSGSDYRAPSNLAPLVSGSDGALYWTAGDGVFRIDGAGNLTTVHSFAGSTPQSDLVLGSDGALYGTTVGSGSSNLGTVFRIDSAGTFTTLHSFSGPDGRYSTNRLVLGSDGSIYGTTESGGSEGITVFGVDSAGTFTTLHTFNGTDGSPPLSPLVVGSDCALYGAAQNGGPSGGGLVYRLYEAGHLCQHIDFDQLLDRTFGDPSFTASATTSSGLPVSFSASGSCSVTGNNVTLTGVGSCTLTASQPGDANFEPAQEVSQSFSVTFAFSGFLRPVENPPALNLATAGRVVPIRFALGGDAGRDVLAEGSPVVRRINCTTSAPLGEFEPALTLGSKRLLHQSGTDRYLYAWKTKPRWAGTCREFALELVDGTVHRANFRFGSPPRAHRPAGR